MPQESLPPQGFAKLPFILFDIPLLCLLITVYIHQVRSYGRSIAVTTLFTADLEESFSSKDCTPDVMTKYHKMSDIDFRWTYRKGDKTIDMGFMNDELVRSRLQEWLKDDDPFSHKDGKMYWKHFIRFGFSFPHMRIAMNYSLAKEVFAHLSQGKGYIDLTMVNNFTREEIKLCVRLVESPHGKQSSLLYSFCTWYTNGISPYNN